MKLNKKLYLAAITGLLALSGCSNHEGNQPSAKIQPKSNSLHTETCPYLFGNVRVIAFGDPVLKADGNLSAKPFVQFIADGRPSLQLRVMSYDPVIITSADMLDAIDDILTDPEYTAQFVVISTGLYDINADIKRENTLANLKKIGKKIREAGRYPIFVAFPEVTNVSTEFLSDSPIFLDLEANGFYVLKGALSKGLSKPEYRVDTLRPNRAGHGVAGEIIKEQLRKCDMSHVTQMGQERKRQERMKADDANSAGAPAN